MMLKAILSNVLFLAACTVIAGLSWGVLYFLKDWDFLLTFIIVNLFLIGKHKNLLFSREELFWDKIKISLIACVITIVLIWEVFQVMGNSAFSLVLAIIDGILLIKPGRPKFGAKEVPIYEEKSVLISPVHMMLNHMLILGAGISLWAMIVSRLLPYIDNLTF